MSSVVSYIEAEELADMILDSENFDKVAIIDVRDDDFYGGNIVNAKNYPSLIWTDDSILDRIWEENQTKSIFVFHCMQSQVRGPRCAQRFALLKVCTLEAAIQPEV
jgi:Cdc25 family phosphatase